jgi:mRNA interferase MazF
VIVSPDELNCQLSTFIVAPLTTGSHAYPFRVPCRFRRKTGFVVLDQVRAVDQGRLVRRLGRLPPPAMFKALTVLQEMFAP